MIVSKSVRIDSALKDAWRVFADMSGVVNYHPWVINSPLLSERNTGKGASRRCEFQDGTSIVETVTESREHEYIKMTLSETPAPMKSGTVSVYFCSVNGGTELRMEMDVKIGLGPIGWIIGPLAVRPLIKSRFEKAMLSMDHFIKTGSKLDPKGNIVGTSVAAT